MKPQVTEKNFFYIFLAVVAIAGIVILWPFFTVIVLGASLSVVLHPLYEKIKKNITGGVSWIASILTTLLFVIILGVPLFFLGSTVFVQSQEMYNSITHNGGASLYIQKISTSVAEILPDGMAIDVEKRIGEVASFLSSSATQIFTSTITTIFSFLLVLLSLFYFLKDGKQWRDMLIEMSPLPDEYDQKILSKLSRAVNGVMKGYLLIALVQGFLMGFGLWIFNVPNPALWGVFAGIASMVPSIGTALVAIPAILYLIIKEDTTGALGFGAWALILVGTIDNLLNPVVVGKNIDLHPLIILFSVLGGISLMGAIGILVGPLVVSLFWSLLSVYKEHFK